MKNKILLVNSIAAIFMLISSATAQNVVDENSGKVKSPEAGSPQMMVQQITPTVSSEVNLDKTATHATQSALKPSVETKGVKSRPAEMNVVLPKEDVKPILPSTLTKPNETNPVGIIIKDGSQANQGPKLAPGQ